LPRRKVAGEQVAVRPEHLGVLLRHQGGELRTTSLGLALPVPDADDDIRHVGGRVGGDVKGEQVLGAGTVRPRAGERRHDVDHERLL